MAVTRMAKDKKKVSSILKKTQKEARTWGPKKSLAGQTRGRTKNAAKSPLQTLRSHSLLNPVRTENSNPSSRVEEDMIRHRKIWEKKIWVSISEQAVRLRAISEDDLNDEGIIPRGMAPKLYEEVVGVFESLGTRYVTSVPVNVARSCVEGEFEIIFQIPLIARINVPGLSPSLMEWKMSTPLVLPSPKFPVKTEKVLTNADAHHKPTNCAVMGDLEYESNGLEEPLLFDNPATRSIRYDDPTHKPRAYNKSLNKSTPKAKTTRTSKARNCERNELHHFINDSDGDIDLEATYIDRNSDGTDSSGEECEVEDDPIDLEF